MNDGLQILGVQFLDEGVEVAYMRVPADVRKNGLLWTHAVLIPRDSDYEDELDTFQQGLKDLLLDALDDEDRAEPIDLPDPDDVTEEDDE